MSTDNRSDETPDQPEQGPEQDDMVRFTTASGDTFEYTKAEWEAIIAADVRDMENQDAALEGLKAEMDEVGGEPAGDEPPASAEPDLLGLTPEERGDLLPYEAGPEELADEEAFRKAYAADYVELARHLHGDEVADQLAAELAEGKTHLARELFDADVVAELEPLPKFEFGEATEGPDNRPDGPDNPGPPDDGRDEAGSREPGPAEGDPGDEPVDGDPADESSGGGPVDPEGDGSPTDESPDRGPVDPDGDGGPTDESPDGDPANPDGDTGPTDETPADGPSDKTPPWQWIGGPAEGHEEDLSDDAVLERLKDTIRYDQAERLLDWLAAHPDEGVQASDILLTEEQIDELARESLARLHELADQGEPAERPSDETPADGPSDETPIDGASDETPTDGLSDESPAGEPVDPDGDTGPTGESPTDASNEPVPPWMGTSADKSVGDMSHEPVDDGSTGGECPPDGEQANPDGDTGPGDESPGSDLIHAEADGGPADENGGSAGGPADEAAGDDNHEVPEGEVPDVEVSDRPAADGDPVGEAPRAASDEPAADEDPAGEAVSDRPVADGDPADADSSKPEMSPKEVRALSAWSAYPPAQPIQSDGEGFYIREMIEWGLIAEAPDWFAATEDNPTSDTPAAADDDDPVRPAEEPAEEPAVDDDPVRPAEEPAEEPAVDDDPFEL